MAIRELEVFAEGEWTDSAGNTRSFNSELPEIAEQDLDLSPVPLVAGHPKTDDPALGWIESLKLNAGKLIASYEDQKLAPGIREFLSAPFRPFRKISVKLWHPEHPSNPRPGKWGLAHVGLLGAVPPAIPGLQNAYASGDVDFTYELACEPMTDPITAPPESTESPPVATEPTYQAPADNSAELAELRRQVEQLAQQNQALSLEYSDTRDQLETERLTRRFDELASSRPELTAHRPQQIEFLASLAKTVSPEFSVGGKSPVEYHLEFLAQAFGEFDPTAPVIPSDEQPEPVIAFNAPPGTEVDREALALHQKALAYATENNVDYLKALKAVGGN